MYQKQKLANGLKLILAPLKETKAVTLLVLFPVGSRYESKEINGVSHFIEHMMFKGTKRRPSSVALSKELDAVGASYNAFTSKDHTGYFIKVAAEHIDLAFDVLSDMILNSLFDEKELNKERGVIIEEINMYEDNPMFYIGNLFEQTVFPDSSLGWLISGPKEVIQKVTRQQLLDFKKNFYAPENMVVSIAGSFSPTKVKALAKKHFGGKSDKVKKPEFMPVTISQCRPRCGLKYKETEQAQVCLGFPGYALNDSRVYRLFLLAVILGGNMSSRLFTIVRELHSLAYYIRADISTYQDTGTLVIQSGLDKSRLDQAIKIILAELKKVKSNGVTANELSAAKEFLKGKLVLELEDSESVASWYGEQELLLNSTLTPEEKIKKIFAVTRDQVKKTAAEIIRPDRLNLAVIGPFKDKKKLEKSLKF